MSETLAQAIARKANGYGGLRNGLYGEEAEKLADAALSWMAATRAPQPTTDADRALAEATIRRSLAEGGNLSDYLAEMIAGVREEAWDEGYDARVRFCRDGHHGNPERNPYRGGAVTG